jgi:hypothetical protein
MLLAELCDRTMEQAAGFIADAQRNGSLRADFGPADLLLLLTSNAAVVAATQQTDPQAWRRHFGFFLDGVRTGATGGQG